MKTTSIQPINKNENWEERIIAIINKLSMTVQDLSDKIEILHQYQQPSTGEKQEMNIKELSAYLPTRPAVKTIRNWLKDEYKNIPAHKLGNRIFFKKVEIDEWLKRNSCVTQEEIDHQLKIWQFKKLQDKNRGTRI